MTYFSRAILLLPGIGAGESSLRRIELNREEMHQNDHHHTRTNTGQNSILVDVGYDVHCSGSSISSTLPLRQSGRQNAAASQYFWTTTELTGKKIFFCARPKARGGKEAVNRNKRKQKDDGSKMRIGNERAFNQAQGISALVTADDAQENALNSCGSAGSGCFLRRTVT